MKTQNLHGLKVGAVICYKYSSGTGKYEGEEKAHLDPEASKREGKEIFVLPAYCTFQVPLEKKPGFWVCYKSEKANWELVPAFENVVMWNKQTQTEKLANGLKFRFTAAFTDKKPPSPFHTWSEKKDNWEYTKVKEHIEERTGELKSLVNQKQNEPFIYKNYELCLLTDRWLIEQAMAIDLLSSPEAYRPVKFVDKDKKRCTLSIEEVKELALELLNRSVKYQMNGRELVEKLLTLKDSKPTYETIKNFDIPL